jgi:hypothetical protein
LLTPKPDVIDPRWPLEKRIWWALEAISNRCDGARKLDGAGYSKYDRPIADRLQGLHLSQWSAKDIDEGLHLIRKYRKQLESMDINIYDVIGSMEAVVEMDGNNFNGADLDLQEVAPLAKESSVVVEGAESTPTERLAAPTSIKPRTNVALLDDVSGGGADVYCELLTGAAGCIAGDSIIGINRGGKSYNGSISYLAKMMNGGRGNGGRYFDKSIPTQIRSVNVESGIILLAPVIQCISSGMKFTFLIKTSTGHEIRATEDHRFLVYRDGNRIWKPLSELGIGECLQVDVGKGVKGKCTKAPYKMVFSMNHHPFKSKSTTRSSIYYRVPEHRLVMEAAINGVEIDDFIEDIKEGHTEGYQFLDPNEVTVHHKDEDSLNNVIDNLVVMPRMEHYKHHAIDGWENVQAHIGPSLITDIQNYGVEETFDITMADSDNPAFLANGLVIHNSGKTFEIRRRIAEDANYALLTATTGIAAINLGTITLNSTLGYFNTESLEESMIKGYLEKRLRDVIESGYKNIVVDEVSMMDRRQLDMIYEGIRRVNERSEWHDKGKLGLILVADFCQLPPIPPKGEKDIPWAFKADCWDKFDANTTRLTKYWRQTDAKFLEAINLIRAGNGRDGARILKDMGINFSMESDKGFDGTTIIAKNDAVEGFNFVAHSRVNGQMVRVNNSRWGKLRKEWEHIPNELSLKIGSYVMILNNDTPAFTFVNGDCGHVTDYQAGGPIPSDILPTGEFTIRLVRNDTEVGIGQITRFNYQKDAPRELGEDNRSLRSAYAYDPDSDDLPRSAAFDIKARKWIVGAVTYYPLRLAYATTVHKSQSLSLDKVQLDVNNHMMKMPGMAYVALSRARTPEGLRIIGTPERLAEVVTVSPEVLKWL